MTAPPRFIALFIVGALALGACSSGGDDLDCDLGNEITSDVQGLANADVAGFEAVRDKMASFEAPDEIADDVDTVIESLDIIIDELNSGQPDPATIQTAGEATDEPGQRIEAYLADNC